jgi:hypothetical protein
MDTLFLDRFRRNGLAFMLQRLLVLVTVLLSAAAGAEISGAPQANISNGLIRATIYLPDPVNGYYRGTRFDWSGVIGHLEYNGHNYYGPWFTKRDPSVSDFIFSGRDIIAGPCSAAMGPVEEFLTDDKALGYDEAKPGGTFIKIGVGVLKKPDNRAYSSYRLYDIVDRGKWSVHPKSDSVEFIQTIADARSGYAYTYTKTLRLTPGKPEMTIEHTLKNTGKQPIQTSVYDHNFLVLDNQPIGPDFVITVPFTIRTDHPPSRDLAEVTGNQIHYVRQLRDRDAVAIPIEGFGGKASDYAITIENKRVGAGMKIAGDRPLEREALWSIRSVLAMEPFVVMSIQPSHEFAWKYTYTYYSLTPEGSAPVK